MTVSDWVGKYGRIAGYTIAVVTLTIFLVRFDGKFENGNRQLIELNTRVTALQVQMGTIQDLVRDREKYDRWRRSFNVRGKRLFNKNGWEYEDVE
jgi:hypothetical protein